MSPPWDEAAATAMETKLLNTDEAQRAHTGFPWRPEQKITINVFSMAIDAAVSAAGHGADPLLALRDALLRICRDHARLTDEAFVHAVRITTTGPEAPRLI